MRSSDHPAGDAPRATYRLQLHAGFTFADAAQIVAYLDDLGISDAYASPMLTPRAGSTHGYDITDHSALNPELGGEDGFEQLSAELRARDMGLVLDVVPNHMGIGDTRNAWWADVLENGPSSIYARYFDIDWDPVPRQLSGKVLLPVLGDQYGDVLDRGELQLRYADGAFAVAYWDHRFPLNPRSYSDLLTHRLGQLIDSQGADSEDVMELQSIITAVKYLPPRSETDPERIAERNREKEVVKRRIGRLYRDSKPVRQAIDATLAEYNGTPGTPRSFDLLDSLLEQQPYRLAFWRVATEEINYRRFFDINDLAAIRVELPEVLDATHQLIFRLLAEGKASGLRIDHPDGLWDPAGYFRQLQERYLAYRAGDAADAADIARQLDAQVLAPAAAEGRPPRWPLYVVAEKILSLGEPLPDDWAVAGTSGYDFLNEVNGIFVDQVARRTLDRLYEDVAGPQPAYASLVNSKKKEIMLVSLSSELNSLSHVLDELSEHNRRYRDFTLNSLTFAIREVIACLAVYRTYITGPETITARDVRYIEQAVREARRRNPRTAGAIFDFLRDTLTLRNLESFAAEARESVLRFVMKFQQLSGPVMAKGVEDTSFYVYNRLVSLNEVGGHPQHFGGTVEELHERAAARARRWPGAMLASSTHDTKRSEDVRARINVLSEMPREWRQLVTRWGRLNAAKRAAADEAMPSRNDEYLLYQTLVGAWPETDSPTSVPASFKERIAAYMEKATREAKVHTSWINPNPEYDQAVQSFVAGILDGRRSRAFIESIGALSRKVAFFGRINALAQTLIKLTAPGAPDIYQGNELWDLSLVDPDNRRPVDYGLRARLLAELRDREAGGDLAELAAELLAQAEDGRVKLYLTERALGLRRERPALFAEGGYLPLIAVGDRADHAVAFARRLGEQEAISVAPRLSLRLAEGEQRPPTGAIWGETWLPLPGVDVGAAYANILTGERLVAQERHGMAGLPMAELLAIFPLALLVRAEV
ncbi:malto-oligosyltrehalose synthase [Oscillochloris sp. ZM17-4]|uniref:malto-oligosyltrehalose synthase n=1 Tax=Oscillochloris sp. ZM17-4 TaxID=2866714 RepID=UPI001C73C2AC|nr:malto-oligosyltrehalose synthase [Oscillochloris sp. ZM17-4]MBX0329733.1 malto-oligosyltrehalose synthase [Oscillochloris sp. ZM17-4]